MIRECPLCGKTHENSASCPCAQQIHDNEEAKFDQVAFNEPDKTKSWKYGTLIEIVTVSILAFILKAILERMLSEEGFTFSSFYIRTAVNVFTILFLSLRYPSKLITLDNFRKVLKYGFVLGAIFPTILILSYGAGLYEIPNDYSEFLTYTGFQEYLWIVNIVVIAPVFEELLFRGSYYRILNIRYNVFLAALLSSLLFALLHRSGLTPFLGAFMKGLLLTYAYHKSGSVWTSIIIHSINNLTSVLFVLIVAP
jgi:membrane protease YdiL (CAAX protease family)